MFAIFWTITVRDSRDAVTGTRTRRHEFLPCYQTSAYAHRKAEALEAAHGDGDLWFAVRQLVADRWIEDHQPAQITDWTACPF